MKKKKKNWKNALKTVLYILLCTVLGLVGGYFIAPYISEITFGRIIYTLLIIWFSLPLHVFLHELGHVLGGLLSGYDFIMFRFFNTVWIKADGGLSKRREYVPGILGQALMVPPETDEGEEPPFFLYHASGILMNILTGLLFIFMRRVISIDWLAYFFNMSSLVAFFLAVINTLPAKGTDGFNILQHFRREETSSEITNLLYMYRDMVRGESLESLQKYLNLESLEDPNAAVVYSLQASYLLEKRDFEGACEIYEMLYENLDQLFEGHRPEVTLSYLYVLLLTDPDHPDIPKIIKSNIYKQISHIKQSDHIRYQAAVELYYNQKLEKAEELLNEGEKYIPSTPTVTDENFEKIMYEYMREDLEKKET